MTISSFRWKQLRQVIQIAEFMSLGFTIMVHKENIHLGFNFSVEVDEECDWIREVFGRAEISGFMPYN